MRKNIIVLSQRVKDFIFAKREGDEKIIVTVMLLLIGVVFCIAYKDVAQDWFTDFVSACKVKFDALSAFSITTNP